MGGTPSRSRASAHEPLAGLEAESGDVELETHRADLTPEAHDALLDPVHEHDDDAASEIHLLSSKNAKTKSFKLPSLGVLGRMKLYLSNTWREIRLHKLNYCLGFAACLIVVIVVSLMMSLLAKAPVVFLRMAESDIGEIDLNMFFDRSEGIDQYADAFQRINNMSRRDTDAFINGLTHTNYTQLAALLAQPARPGSKWTAEQFSYHAPRFNIYKTAIYGDHNCGSGADFLAETGGLWYLPAAQNETGCPLGGASQNCISSYCRPRGVTVPFPGVRGWLYLIDTPREERMGVGRSYGLPPVPRGELYMHEEVARRANLQLGEKLWLRINILDSEFKPFLEGAITSAGFNRTTRDRRYWSDVNLPFTVTRFLNSSGGKLSSSNDEFMFMEFADFIPYVAEMLNPRTPDSVRQAFANYDLYQYAESVIFNLPPSRLDFYLSDDFDDIQDSVVSWTTDLIYRIGFTQFDVTLPILNSLNTYSRLSLFLGLILNIIISVLSGLAIVLIYSLLMINVEARTFEMGVLRVVGATRRSIIELLLVQALAYALPAFSVGCLLSQVTFGAIAKYLSVVTTIEISTALTSESVALAALLGIGIPMVAAILPIRSALGRSLLQALDTQHSKSIAPVEVSVNRSEDGKVSWSWIIVGTVLGGFGFFIYYVFPLALMSLNISLLLNVFFSLILGMLIGLTLLAMNFQSTVERGVLYVLARWWEKPSVLAVIKKNFVAHRVRNRKTALLYSTALGVIILITVSYSIQIDSLIYQNMQQMGGKIALQGAIDVTMLDALLGSLREEGITGWTYVTPGLHEVSIFTDTAAYTIGRARSEKFRLYGIMSNFFNVADDTFLIEDDPPAGYWNLSVAERLYTVAGSAQVVLSSGYQTSLALENTTQHFVLENDGSSPASTYPVSDMHRMWSAAFVDSTPHFTFSRFPEAGRAGLVSLPTFVRMTAGAYSSVDALPFDYCIVHLDSSLGDADVDKVFSMLLSTPDMEDVSVLSSRSRIVSTQTASAAVSYFFDFTTIVAMILSYFSLVGTMMSNIRSQTKEIAVLRALGMTKAQLRRVYTLEALTLVLSASFLGFIIGVSVSYTMALQRFLFTQLPIPFAMPYQTIIIVVITSGLSALGAAYIPIRRLMKNPITTIMRMV